MPPSKCFWDETAEGYNGHPLPPESPTKRKTSASSRRPLAANVVWEFSRSTAFGRAVLGFYDSAPLHANISDATRAKTAARAYLIKPRAIRFREEPPLERHEGTGAC